MRPCRTPRAFASLSLGSLLGLSLLLAPSAALAGDPCPIGFEVYDVGPPEWLDRDALLSALVSKDSWVGMSFRSAKDGIEVRAVSDGSPAAKAGLLVGDLITSFGAARIVDHEVAGVLLRKRKPGDMLELKVNRDAGEVALTLTLGAQDPVVGALIDEASSRECSSVRRANVDAARAAAVRAAVFSKARRFRCDDAHKALKKAGLEGGDIVVVRGTTRLLVSNAGWGTKCLKPSDLDGPKLTPKAIGKVLDAVAKRYVRDRHDNP